MIKGWFFAIFSPASALARFPVCNRHLGEILNHESGGIYRVEVEDADKPEHEIQTIHAIRLDFIPKKPAT